jgi:hypothetical protein
MNRVHAVISRGSLLVLFFFTLTGNAAPQPLTLERLEKDTFRYFWETTDKNTGLAPDRYPSKSPASIAAVGFALTSYPIGVENGYISRKQAVDRTLATLRFFWSLPLGPEKKEVAGYQGFYYHFLKMKDGSRSQDWEIELSTVDTAMLMAGVLFSQSYFDGKDKNESEIRALADKLYRRVNWQWAQNNKPLVSLGWFPDKGFLDHDWVGYNEAMLVYILALGSPTYALEAESWQAWTAHYQDDWGVDNGIEYLTFGPIFGHQYSHIWIDFRDIQDEFMKEKNSTYFLNSKKAAYAQRQYAITNPELWDGYGENQWGLTASDGPGKFNKVVNGRMRKFLGYNARGVGINHSFDDGTLAPTALVGSLPFAPEIVLPAIQATYESFGKYLYTRYGFLDSYNPSFKFSVTSKIGKVIPNVGWIANDYIGIDQGAILAMAENYHSGLIWRIMRKNQYIKRGLERAGFAGGWLEDDKKNHSKRLGVRSIRPVLKLVEVRPDRRISQ